MRSCTPKCGLTQSMQCGEWNLRRPICVIAAQGALPADCDSAIIRQVGILLDCLGLSAIVCDCLRLPPIASDYILAQPPTIELNPTRGIPTTNNRRTPLTDDANTPADSPLVHPCMTRSHGTVYSHPHNRHNHSTQA